MLSLSDKSRDFKEGLIRQLFGPYYRFKTSCFELPSALKFYETICELSVYLPQILLMLIQGDQKVSVHLMITIQSSRAERPCIVTQSGAKMRLLKKN